MGEGRLLRSLSSRGRHERGKFPGWEKRWKEVLPKGADSEVFGPGFMNPMARQHRVAMEERPYYCEFFEVSFTLVLHVLHS